MAWGEQKWSGLGGGSLGGTSLGGGAHGEIEPIPMRLEHALRLDASRESANLYAAIEVIYLDVELSGTNMSN